MPKVVLDESTLAKLTSNGSSVEVYNESGRVVGYFSVAGDGCFAAKQDMPYTEEDLDRFEAEPGGRALAEILAALEKRP